MSYTYRPNSVNLFSDSPDQEVSWKTNSNFDTNFLLGFRWSTVRSLLHRSNPATGDLRDRTWQLHCTNFNMTDLPNTITGIQLDLMSQRNGRIVDETIQLVHQGEPIGNNNFMYILDSEGHFYLNNQTSYGGPTDLWGAELTKDMLEDPSFGVILKFQSHPYYPHSCGMFLDSVSITVY